MGKPRSFISYLAEAVEDYRADHRSAAAEPIEPERRNRLHWLVRQMIPNIGTLILVVVLLFTVPSLAAPRGAATTTSTSTISYQGRLADSGGNPLTGMYNLEFRIYDVPSVGTPLWEAFWTGGNSVQVSDGLFNVMLGSIETDLAASIEGYDELYLGITVDTDAEMEPRVQLGSVPFAMSAQSLVGQVTTEQIEDGAVTTGKLDIVGDFAFVDALGTTASTTYESFATPLKVTLNPDTACDAMIWYSMIGKGGGPAKRALTKVFVDGTELGEQGLGYTERDGYGMIARQMVRALDAGSHEIEVKRRTEGGRTAVYERGTLTVICVPVSAE